MQIKYLLLVPFIFLCMGIQSQNVVNDSVHKVNKPVYRAEAGYSQTLRYSETVSSTSFYTILAGATVEFPLQYNFGIQTGLNYNFSLGNKIQYYGNIVTQSYNKRDTVKYNYTNHTLTIPIKLTYSVPIMWGMKLFAYAGPNFNIGLAEPTDVWSAKNLYVQNGAYDAYKDKINRFNIQFGAGGGIQWKKWRIKSGYDWGLLNLSKTQNQTEYNKGWMLALEYEF